VSSFNVKQYLEEKCEYVEQAMPAFLQFDHAPPRLREAMEYSLFAGGKRLRPILLLATLEAFGGASDKGLPAACAVEMIHTYSLIHDDLPAMDDDNFRRGKPTNHMEFGEATAILAGDGLLTHAFHTVCQLLDCGIDASRVVQIIQELARFAGPDGMVGGQMADLLGEGRRLLLPELQFIHEHKTADLLVFSIRAGAILGGASAQQTAHMTTFANRVGLAFQIQDDLLDIYGESAKLGKSTGSDEAKAKSTYPALLGLEQSKQELSRLIDEAEQALHLSGAQTEILRALSHFIIHRDH
jgi:geranylgeranyl diphosphate synthase type II